MPRENRGAGFRPDELLHRQERLRFQPFPGFGQRSKAIRPFNNSRFHSKPFWRSCKRHTLFFLMPHVQAGQRFLKIHLRRPGIDGNAPELK